MNEKKPNYHHGDLRAALIAETLHLLETEGAAAISLRALGERLGVSRSAAYRHFTDKADLLGCVAEQGFEQFRAALRAAAAEQTSVLEQFRAMGHAYVQFALENPASYQLMFHQAGILSNAKPELKQAADAAFQELVGILKRGQQAGVVKQEDVQAQAVFVWSTMHGLSSLLLAQRLPVHDDPQELRSLIEKQIFYGIGKNGWLPI